MPLTSTTLSQMPFLQQLNIANCSYLLSTSYRVMSWPHASRSSTLHAGYLHHAGWTVGRKAKQMVPWQNSQPCCPHQCSPHQQISQHSLHTGRVCARPFARRNTHARRATPSLAALELPHATDPWRPSEVADGPSAAADSRLCRCSSVSRRAAGTGRSSKCTAGSAAAADRVGSGCGGLFGGHDARQRGRVRWPLRSLGATLGVLPSAAQW